jgi:hypothetical protein
MGFFSGITQALTGGSNSSSSSQSGFALLPPSLQQAYTQYGTQLNNLTSNPATGANAFTPMPLTSGETTALNNLNQGFTPTSQSLQSDLSMLQNPYNDSVINLMNNQAAGQNSLVNQAATQAGQQGSNRSFLGTSDVEQNRLNNIGAFQQDQYNTALNQVLNNLVPQRQQDAANALTAGTYQRGLDTQTQQAPYQSMLNYAQLLGVIPTSGGSTGTSSGSSSNGGLLSLFK